MGDNGGMLVTMAAHRIAAVRNREVRDVLAYMLDEAHAWKPVHLGEDCEAIVDAFTDPGDGETTARRVLQPVSEWMGWYVHGTVSGFVDRFIEWDEDEFADHPDWRWRFRWSALDPRGVLPKRRSNFARTAKQAAEDTWYSADMFIAEYILVVARRLSKDFVGIPVFFLRDDMDWEESAVYYRYSLEALADAAEEAINLDNDEGTREFPQILAEAMEIGMLWD